MKNDEGQLIFFRNKGSCMKSKELSILKIIKDNAEAQKCLELKIMHCPQLSSISGIQKFKKVTILNLSSNIINGIIELKALTFLKCLDIKSNRIESLKGLQLCLQLQKLDASHNKLKNLDGLGDTKDKLQYVSFCGNELSDLNQINRLANFNKLKEIYFQKKKASNPFCQDKNEYQAALKQFFKHHKTTINKIDDKSEEQLLLLFSEQQSRQLNNSMGRQKQQRIQNSQQYENSGYFEKKRHFNTTNMYNPQYTSNNKGQSNQHLMMMTQRQFALEEVVALKQDVIQELKSKNSQLEITNANFYKDSIKRQIQYERLYGQIGELSKQIDQKDAKINQLHRRVQELLKVNTNANILSDNRSLQTQKLRKQCGDYKIQASQLRALNKDQQSRLRELQNRSLQNIEEKAKLIEQLRRKNEDCMKDNYELRHQQQEYKDRIRQLTQLLREWEYKYEQKVKELQSYHGSEKAQIIKEYEQRQNQYTQNNQHHIRKIYSEFEGKIKTLQQEYGQAIDSSLQKYKQLKRAYDEKLKTESEIKMLLKTVMTKNTEQQHTINECQQVIISSRKKINELSYENESFIKECSEIRGRYQIETKQMQNQIVKLSMQKNRLEKDNNELRSSNQYLQNNFDKLNYRQKEAQQWQQKIQNLQTALDAKNVMLDDKNETIDNLKLEIQNIQKQQEGKMDSAQFQKLQIKYRKTKDKIKEVEEQLYKIAEQNKQLTQKLEIYGNMEQEFTELRNIMGKQESQINQKNQNIVELIQTIEKLKNHIQTLQQEINSLRKEKNRLIDSKEEQEARWNRTLQDKENLHQKNIAAVQEQMLKYKGVAMQLRQLTSLTKNLQF